MLKNPIITRLRQELDKKYKEDNEWLFCDKFTKSGAVKEEFEDYLEEFYDGTFFTHVGFEVLAHFSLERSIYAIMVLQDKTRFQQEIVRSTAYGYLMITSASQSCGCFQGRSSIPMHRALIHFALNVLILSEESIKKTGEMLINSVNAENCVIGRGGLKAYRDWFILELYSKAINKEISKKRAYYPDKGFADYENILKLWDTEDLQYIDFQVNILCEMHLSSALTPINEENEDEKKYNLELPHIELFPYEILVWLKLREKEGLKNPKTFTHPLMNTPIAKMFLDIKEPLPKPTELPYGKELLEKLKEQCPDVEVPEWLEGNTEKVNEAKSNDIIPDDFLK